MTKPKAEKPPTYDNQFDRDKVLERKYTLAGHHSLLARINTDKDELVQKFWMWRSLNRGGTFEDAVRRWEIEVFGAEAYKSAHSVLVFALLDKRETQPGMHPAEGELFE